MIINKLIILIVILISNIFKKMRDKSKKMVYNRNNDYYY